MWPGSPFRPLIDDINRAILDQSGITAGTGFGQVGNKITRTSQDWMVAFTDTNGVPAATYKDPTNKKLGRDIGSGVAYEQTIETDGTKVSIVPSGPDAVTEIPCFNFSASSSVQGDTLVILEKLFGLWVVTWEECSGQ